MEQFIDNFYSILEETEKSEINPKTIFKDLDEWDSMTALMLIAMFDEKYQIKLNGNDIKNANSLEDLFLITQK
jgi:acyl carrier protein